MREAPGRGGPLYDPGVYCINAARYLFRAEPIEVFAQAVSLDDPRFREVDETVSALLRFPGERLAGFTSSFGAMDVAEYRVVGTEGELRVEPSFEYAEGLTHHLNIKGRRSLRRFPKRDVRVIDALHESLRTRGPVSLRAFSRVRRPHLGQEIRRPPVRKPEEIRAQSPHLEMDDS